MTLRPGITHITDSGPECPHCRGTLWGYIRAAFPSPARFTPQCASCHSLGPSFDVPGVALDIARVRASHTAAVPRPCDSCSHPVYPDEFCGNDRPDGTSEYLCPDCYVAPTPPSDFTRCGLNADWNCDAWHVGPGSDPAEHTGDIYLLDNEDGGWLVVRRWHLDDCGIYVGMPTGVYDDWCDGANDAIPELFETDDLDAAVAFCRSVLATLSEVK